MIEASFGAAPMALARRAGPRSRARRRDTPASNSAWPRSHAAQIAKRRLQRRQVFWRSGVSTASEQRRFAPTGRTAQTVAQQTGRPRRVGARGGHEGPEVQSGPSPSVHAAYAITRSQTSAEAVDGAASVDAQNAPTSRLENHRAGFPHRPPPFLFIEGRRPTKGSKARTARRPPSRFTRFQVSADMPRPRPQKGQLESLIDETEAAGLLAAHLAQTAHAIRRSGNAVGHERPAGDDAARRVLEQTRQVIQDPARETGTSADDV